jgi:hypothetical protein
MDRKEDSMENRFGIVTLANAVCVAGYAAISLRYVALYDLGLSNDEIRNWATLLALIIAAYVAIDFLGRMGKAR